MALRDLISDERFLNLPEIERSKVIERLAPQDGGFLALPDTERVKVMNRLVKQPKIEVIDQQPAIPPKQSTGSYVADKFTQGALNTTSGIAGMLAPLYEGAAKLLDTPALRNRKQAALDVAENLFGASQGMRAAAKDAEIGYGTDDMAQNMPTRLLGTAAQIVPNLAAMVVNPALGVASLAPQSVADGFDNVDAGLSTGATLANIGVDTLGNVAGMYIPAFGKTAKAMIGTGVAANVGQGIVTDGAKNLITGAESEQLAEKYNPFNAEARLADALLGGVGGYAQSRGIPSQQMQNDFDLPVGAVEPDLANVVAGLLPQKDLDPMISFPDGSVGRQSEVDAYVQSLPENQQLPMRAKLAGLGTQKADVLKIEPDLATMDADDAVAAQKQAAYDAEQMLPQNTVLNDQLKNDGQALGIAEPAITRPTEAVNEPVLPNNEAMLPINQRPLNEPVLSQPKTENAIELLPLNESVSMADSEPRQVATVGGKKDGGAITVRDNGQSLDVLYDGEPLINFDTEANVSVARNAGIDDIKAAVKSSGQFSKKTPISYDKTYAPVQKSEPFTIPEQGIKNEQSVTPNVKRAAESEPPEATSARQARMAEIGETIRAWLPSMDWATVGGRMIRDADGNVTGRTLWTPIDPEFGSLKEGLTQSLGNNISFKQIREANQKALDGKSLTKKERNIVDATIRMHDNITKQSDDIQAELDSKGYTDADADSVANTLTDNEINAELRYAGFDERTSNTEATDFDAQSEVGSVEQGAANAEARPDIELARESNADIARRESEVKAREDKLKAEQKAFDDKKKADAEAPEFTLRGSDRDADVAASKGQKSIFDEPSSDAKLTTNAPKVDNEPAQKQTRTGKAIDELDDLNDSTFEDSQDARNYVRGSFGTLNSGADPAQIIGAFIDLFKAGDSELTKNTRQAYKDVFKAFKDSKTSAKERLAKVGGAVFIGEASALRLVGKARNSKAIEKVWSQLSDMGGVEGVKGQTYEDAVVSRANADTNAVAKAIAPFKNNPNDIARIKKLIENRNAIDINKPLGKVASDIAKILDRHLAEQRDAGMITGENANYFPRQYKTNVIVNKAQAFKEAAASAYMADAKQSGQPLTQDAANQLAESWYYKITSEYDGHVDTPFANFAQKSGKESFEKERMISNEAFASSGLDKFVDPDVLSTIEGYIRKSSRRIEFEKRFGGTELNKNGSVKTNTAKMDAILKELEAEGNTDLSRYVVNAVASMTGQGRQGSANTRAAVSLIGAIQTTQLLRRAVISSLTEGVQTYNRTAPLQGQIKGAVNAAKTYGEAIFDLSQYLKLKPLTDMIGMKGVRLSREEQIAVSEMMGAVVNNHVINSASAHRFDDFTNLDVEANVVQKAANAMSAAAVDASYLRRFTNSNIVSAVTMGRGFIAEMAKQISNPSKNTKLAEYEAGRLGLTPEQAKSLHTYLQKGKTPDTMFAEKLAKNDDAVNYFNALDKFQKQVIAQATAANKPSLAKHPVARIAFGFQGWMSQYWYNVQRVNIKQVALAMSKKESFTLGQRANLLATPLVSTAITTAFVSQVLTSLRDMVSGKNQNEDYQEEQAETIAGIEISTLRKMSQSNWFGLADPYVNKLTGARYNSDMIGSFAGAFAGNVAKVVRTKVQEASDTNSENTNTAERASATATYNAFIDPAIAALTAVSPYAPAATIAGQRDELRRFYVDGMAGKKEEIDGGESDNSGLDSSGLSNSGLNNSGL